MRKADELAGKGSFLDKLRQRRKAIEGGDLDGASKPFKKKDKNSPGKTMKRGYTRHQMDEY